MLDDSNQFNWNKIIRPLSPRHKIQPCTICSSPNCDHVRAILLNIQTQVSAQKSEQVESPRQRGFIECISITRERTNKDETNPIQTQTGESLTKDNVCLGSIAVSVKSQRNSSIEHQRGSLYEYKPLDLDIFELYESDSNHRSVQQSKDVGSSVYHQMEQWSHDSTQQERNTLLQRPRKTFMNRHAEFNRKNIVAVNRLNKVQIQANNLALGQRMKPQKLFANETMPIRMSDASTEKFIFITGVQTPRDFFASPKSTFHKKRNTVQPATKHDYIFHPLITTDISHTGANSRRSSRQGYRPTPISRGALRFGVSGGNSPMTPMSVDEEGVKGQRIQQLVENYSKRKAREPDQLANQDVKSVTSVKSTETQAFAMNPDYIREDNQNVEGCSDQSPKPQSKGLGEAQFFGHNEEFEINTQRAETPTNHMSQVHINEQRLRAHGSKLSEQRKQSLANKNGIRGDIYSSEKQRQFSEHKKRRGSNQSINQDLKLSHKSGQAFQDPGTMHPSGTCLLETKQQSPIRGPKWPVRQLTRSFITRRKTPINILSFQAEPVFNAYTITPKSVFSPAASQMAQIKSPKEPIIFRLPHPNLKVQVMSPREPNPKALPSIELSKITPFILPKRAFNK